MGLYLKWIDGFPANLLSKKLKWIGDLKIDNCNAEAESAILSVYRTRNGKPYLWSWAESAEGIERWLVIQTTPLALAKHVAGQISHRELIPLNQNNIGLVLVVDYLGHEIVRQDHIACEDIPSEYLPGMWVKFDHETTTGLFDIKKAFCLYVVLENAYG